MAKITIGRVLAFSTDSVTAHQGGAWTVAATQSGAWTVAATQSGAWTVTANAGSGTFNVQDNASKQDDVSFAPGTDRVLVMGAEADETTPDSVDEGDAGALRMTLARALHVNFRNTAGTEIGTSVAPVRTDPTGTTVQPVSGTVAATQSGAWTVAATQSGAWTVDTELPAAAALADNTANPTVPGVGSFMMGFDGTNWDRVRADGGAVFVQDGGNSISVDDGGGSLTVDGTVAVSSITTGVTPGTAASNLGKAEDSAHATGDVGVMALAVRNDSAAQNSLTSTDGDYSPIATDVKGNSLVVGNLPHDAVDVGNPLKIGGKATTATSEPTAVASGDRVDAFFDTKGYLLNKPVPFRGAVSTVMNAQVFNNSTTSAASSSIDTDQYGWVNIHLNIDSTNAPTRIQFIPQFSNDGGTTWIDYDQDFFQAIHFEDTEVASVVNKGYQLPVFGDDFRVNVVATGTDATNTFTVTIKVQPQTIR